MVNLWINYLVGHYSARWLCVVSAPVSIEEEASIEYLTHWYNALVVWCCVQYMSDEPMSWEWLAAVNACLFCVHLSDIQFMICVSSTSCFYACLLVLCCVQVHLIRMSLQLVYSWNATSSWGTDIGNNRCKLDKETRVQCCISSSKQVALWDMCKKDIEGREDHWQVQ